MSQKFPYEISKYLTITDLAEFRKRAFKNIVHPRTANPAVYAMRYLPIMQNQAYRIVDNCPSCKQFWIEVDGERIMLHTYEVEGISTVSFKEHEDLSTCTELRLMDYLYDVAINTDRNTFLKMVDVIKRSLEKQNTE